MKIETEGILVNDTKSQILAIREQCFLMGANDAEKTKFDEIIALMEKGEFSEAEALEEAHKILSSKNDYHQIENIQ